MKKDWIEREDVKFIVQLSNFAGRIGTYATTFGLTAPELADIQKDSEFAAFIIMQQATADNYKQGWTKLKESVRYGADGGASTSFPSPVDISLAPVAVAPGIEKRFRELVKRIKANANYTLTIGEALGIDGVETATDPASGKPYFKISLDSGQPVLKWTKGIYDGVEIWVNRGTGFVKLDRDNKSPYVDRFALPALGQSAVWVYKMIYVLEDETIGDWSDEVTATVYGAV